MVFRKARYPGYYYRLAHGGRARVVGLDTTDVKAAERIENFAIQLRHDRRWDVIDGILDRKFTLPEAYDHRASLDQWLAARTEVDLEPLVARWNGRGRRAVSEKYITQVRAFIPAGVRFPLSRFRRREIAAFLEGLDVSDPTRNRYKAALSQFARWLVRHEYLEANPVRDAGSFGEHDPRTVHLSPEDAKAVVDRMTGEAKVVAALMAGTGMEWQAVDALTRGDIDLEARTIRAHGAKNRWRDRTVAVTEDWTWPVIQAHAASLLPAAKFVSITKKAAMTEQGEVCATLKLPRHRLHDWRHTYAVTAIKRGDDHQAIKRQLGHAPHSALLYTRYGVYMHMPVAAKPKARGKRKVAR